MRIGAFGEVMLRLTPPEHLLLEQTHMLRAAYTGTGVNLAGNLAHFGVKTSLLTALPDNRLGEAALSNLRSLGIDTEYILMQHQHIGTYFAEMGFGPRPTQVTYQNRHHSSFGLSKAENYATQSFIEQTDMIHICGISLSLSEETARTALLLAKEAYEAGKQVCFDFNFRPSLNQEKEKKTVMRERYQAILPYCSAVFGSARDLLGLLGETLPEDPEDGEVRMIQNFLEKYELDWFAGTRRTTKAGVKQISGYLITQSAHVSSSDYPLSSLDRIGAGDAYAAGILLGVAESWPLQESVDFAIGNALLAHTIQGDVPLTTRKQVRQLLDHPNEDLIR